MNEVILKQSQMISNSSILVNVYFFFEKTTLINFTLILIFWMNFNHKCKCLKSHLLWGILSILLLIYMIIFNFYKFSYHSTVFNQLLLLSSIWWFFSWLEHITHEIYNYSEFFILIPVYLKHALDVNKILFIEEFKLWLTVLC